MEVFYKSALGLIYATYFIHRDPPQISGCNRAYHNHESFVIHLGTWVPFQMLRVDSL